MHCTSLHTLMLHRLQLSQNLQDSPGSGDFVFLVPEASFLLYYCLSLTYTDWSIVLYNHMKEVYMNLKWTNFHYEDCCDPSEIP